MLALGDSQLALSTDAAVAAVGLQSIKGNPLELVVWCGDDEGVVEGVWAHLSRARRGEAGRRVRALGGAPDGLGSLQVALDEVDGARRQAPG